MDRFKSSARDHYYQLPRRQNKNIAMSGTLISSLVWVPRGRAALEPKKYTLDEEELQRVGKLGGEGVLEKLREEMEGMEMSEGEWEECVQVSFFS